MHFHMQENLTFYREQVQYVNKRKKPATASSKKQKRPSALGVTRGNFRS